MLVALLALRADPLSLGSDPWIYQHMAEDPLGYLPLAPFGYRVLTPLLVAALPLPVPIGFTLVSWLGLTGAALVVRRTAAALAGAGAGLAALGLFLGSGLVFQVIQVPYATDPLGLALGAGALEAGRRRRWVLAAALVTVGAANRETVVFVLLPLLALVVQERGWTAAAARLGGLVAVGPAVVTVAIRATPLLYGEVLPSRVLGPGAVYRFNDARSGGAGGLLVLSVLSATGVLVPLLVARRRELHGYLAASLLFVVPNVAGILVATDWPRVIGTSILVLAPAAAVVVPSRRRGALVAVNVAVCWLAWIATAA